MLNKAIIAVLLIICLSRVECVIENTIYSKDKKLASPTTNAFKVEKTFPLKDGEAAIRRNNNTRDEGFEEKYDAASDKKIYEYFRSESSRGKVISYIVTSVNMENKENYTQYAGENCVDDVDNSFIWFDNVEAINSDLRECGLQPGRHNLKEMKDKCGFGGSNCVALYFYKMTEDAKEVYQTFENTSIGNIEQGKKYEIVSYSELERIINDYPQPKSSSILVPSFLIVVALIFLMI